MDFKLYLDLVLQFLANWWGLFLAVIVLVLLLIFDFQRVKKMAIRLIFIAEERAREYALETGKLKFDWVVQHGYQYVPPWLKLFLSEMAFRALVQGIFDSMVHWAEKQELRQPSLE